MSANHEDIKVLVRHIEPTGSRYICNPPPTDTDEDYIVLAMHTFEAFDIVEHMEAAGYTTDGCETYDILCELDSGGWSSFKRGDINYIITLDSDFFIRFWEATQEAKKLNLLDKADRVALFQKILYGEEND